MSVKQLIRDMISIRVVVKILASGARDPGFEPAAVTVAATIS